MSLDAQKVLPRKLVEATKKKRTTHLGSADECVSNFGTISGFIVRWKGSLGRTCWFGVLHGKGEFLKFGVELLSTRANAHNFGCIFTSSFDSFDSIFFFRAWTSKENQKKKLLRSMINGGKIVFVGNRTKTLQSNVLNSPSISPTSSSPLNH